MAKISEESRKVFLDVSEQYNHIIKGEFQKEKEILAQIKEYPYEAGERKLALAEEMIYIATLYNAINTSSLKILQVKNSDALNEGRKMLYKSLIYLEELVTKIVNTSQSDLSEKLDAIHSVPLEQRYFLIRKLGLAIQIIIKAFGENSKWKLSFVEIEGRYATVAKNLFDFKTYVKSYFDPSLADHEYSILYIRLIKELLEKSAQSYRHKYEISSRRVDDLKQAISFLLALRSVCNVIGESDEAEELKKRAASWEGRLKADQKSGKNN